jgi:hypothetical protein
MYTESHSRRMESSSASLWQPTTSVKPDLCRMKASVTAYSVANDLNLNAELDIALASVSKVKSDKLVRVLYLE